jgi:hypothetical protein
MVLTGKENRNRPDGINFGDISSSLAVSLWALGISQIIYLSTYLSIYLSFIYNSTVFLLDLGRLFNFLTLYTVSTTPWTGDQPRSRPLSTHRTAQTQNNRIQVFMPSVEFEYTTPVRERMKTFIPCTAQPLCWIIQSNNRLLNSSESGSIWKEAAPMAEIQTRVF